MTEWKEKFKESQKLIEGLKELGLTDLDAERLERLMTFSSTPEEKQRWIECGVLDPKGEKIKIDESVNDENFSIEICLWNAVYNGILIKTKKGYQNSGVFEP